VKEFLIREQIISRLSISSSEQGYKLLLKGLTSNSEFEQNRGTVTHTRERSCFFPSASRFPFRLGYTRISLRNTTGLANPRPGGCLIWRLTWRNYGSMMCPRVFGSVSALSSFPVPGFVKPCSNVRLISPWTKSHRPSKKQQLQTFPRLEILSNNFPVI